MPEAFASRSGSRKRGSSRGRSKSPSGTQQRSKSLARVGARGRGATSPSSPRATAARADPHPHLGRKNLSNIALTLAAPIPSIWAARVLFSRRCDAVLPRWACEAGPVAQVNLLFFVNVTVGFWLVGLLQGNFWLIDPYWTLIPPLIALFVHCDPRNIQPVPLRLQVATALLALWSARLTHSYFRRERWRFGERQDWRYEKMSRDHPRAWPVLSFFAVGLAQQPMLVGVSLPLFSAARADAPWTPLDSLAATGCLAGLLLGFAADNTLFAYMERNRALAAERRPPVELLEAGAWRWSRHPNYLGEITWWTSFALFAAAAGDWAALAGTALNTAVLVVVAGMTERRMLDNWPPARAARYRAYQTRTGCILPVHLWHGAAGATRLRP